MKHSLSFTAVLLLPFCALAAVGTSTEINVQVVGQAKVIEAIQLCSTSGATVVANTPSPPMFLLVFKKGDIPAGQYPQLQATDGMPWGATFINVRHWSDGSVKIAGVLPGPFPKAIPTSCVTANILNGGVAPAPSGLTPAQLYGAQIALNANGFPDPLGSAFSLTGNWQAKLAGDANNVEVVDYSDGPGGRVYRILTHVQQNGAPHGQMEVYWYVQQLLDGNGAQAGVRVLARLTQPWYNQDTPAKNWRGIQTFNLQYGAGATTIAPPFPFNDVDLPAANWAADGANDFTPSATTPPNWPNETTGYFTTTGTLPTGLLPNTIYCASWDRTHVRIVTDCSQAAFGLTNGGTGTHTFHPIPVLPHFGSLFTARDDGRYSYIPGTVGVDAPIQVKGNPVYDQATRIFPPYDLSFNPPPNPNPAQLWWGFKPIWNLLSSGTIGTGIDVGGERDEIGIRTAWFARWFYNRTRDDEKYVRINGFVSGLFANAIRDVTTRGPVHLGDPANSYAGMPASLATSFHWQSAGGTGGFTAPAHGGPQLFFSANDSSHMPDLAGSAYLATGEPQFLDMQMEWADHSLFSRALAERNPTINGINYYGATTYNSGWGIRQMAWDLRPIVDADAWWPDSDPAGTQVGKYLHDQEQVSTLLPQITVPLENAWGASNCYWNPPGGGSRAPWQLNYMNTVMVDAYNNDEDANALSFLNCSATWYQHVFDAFHSGYILYGIDEKLYDTGNLASPGSLAYISANFTWSSGTATLTLADSSQSGALFDGETVGVSATGYSGSYTITRTGPTTATFPLASNPGGSASGIFEAIGKLVSSDANYSVGPTPPTGFYQVAWQSGTPGTISEQYAVPNGNSWNPADGDKIVFPPYNVVNPGTVPGGLLSSKPYYVVGMHTGPNSGMTWTAGTLTVTTGAPHGLRVGGSRVMGIIGADASGLGGVSGTGLTNCTITDATHYTCPVASDPHLGTNFGSFNTANLSDTPGGAPLSLTDTSSVQGAGVIPANPPAGYWVDYAAPDSYLPLARNALNSMIASGISGLSAYKFDVDNRFSQMLTFDNQTLPGFFAGNPKNAMATSFGARGVPPSAPIDRRGGGGRRS